MARPTRIEVVPSALMHNLNHVRTLAPRKDLVAMVKANAYGCGIETVAPLFDGHVEALGVASLEEAVHIRRMGVQSECILFEGIFAASELTQVLALGLQIVIHNTKQLQWVLDWPLPEPVKVWVKVNTGMHRLGFTPQEGEKALHLLKNCPWVHERLGLMSHFACADVPGHALNAQQTAKFCAIKAPQNTLLKRSMANSAAIMALPQAYFDMVRPGIMLYGVSPFATQSGMEAGLRPVMRFFATVIAIQHCQTGDSVGYGADWQAQRPSRIAVLSVGYGDGYPRHVAEGTCVYIANQHVPVIGRISMDMLTVDVTDFAQIKLGDEAELWGEHIPIEQVAKASGTIAYELLCQVTQRPRIKNG